MVNATDEDVAELEALHHELIAAASRNNQEVVEEKNHAFHREINLMAESRKIAWALELVTRYVPRRFYSAIEGWPAATVDDHTELLDGIRTKDPEATRSAMSKHIIHAGELLAEHFDRRIAEAAEANASSRAPEGDVRDPKVSRVDQPADTP